MKKSNVFLYRFPIHKDQYKKVIDIGGNTEIIYGNNSIISFNKNFNVGVVSLTEDLLFNRPVGLQEQEIFKAEQKINKIFGNLSNKIPPGIETIPVASTPTTLSNRKQKIRFYGEAKVNNSTLTYESIKSLKKFNPYHQI